MSYYQEIGSEALDYLLSFSYVPNTREASFGMLWQVEPSVMASGANLGPTRYCSMCTVPRE